MDIAKSTAPILTGPVSNYLGGNTAAYETAQTANKISGGGESMFNSKASNENMPNKFRSNPRRTKRRGNKNPKTKKRQANRRKNTRRTRSNWSRKTLYN
jgi:hypothetical protein